MNWRIGSNLTKGCIVIDDSISTRRLNAKIESLYLVTSKLFPIVNSRYTSHWSVIVKTDMGLFNITTARYTSIYIYPVYKGDIYHFDGGGKWESRFYILKQYPVKDKYVESPVTLYDVALTAMKFYTNGGNASYSVINHNCHHVSQYIIRKFGKADPMDELLVKYEGKPLILKSISDAVSGSKIMF
jgi:hypothetical protein